jgi:hypothetical protein
VGAPDSGSRRIDRVLSENYLAGLSDLPIEEVRSLRQEAEQEETDVSYLRRLLQGRIDILKAELDRRAGGSHERSLVEELPQILAEDTRATHGLGRYSAVEPSRADAHRRHVEALVADVDLDDVSARGDDELRRALAVYETEERDQSEKRRAIQRVMDACAAEIARRYKEGQLDVSDVLNR